MGAVQVLVLRIEAQISEFIAWHSGVGYDVDGHTVRSNHQRMDIPILLERNPPIGCRAVELNGVARGFPKRLQRPFVERRVS